MIEKLQLEKLAKYQRIVEEDYNKYLQIQQKAFENNGSQNEVEQETKKTKVWKGLVNVAGSHLKVREKLAPQVWKVLRPVEHGQRTRLERQMRTEGYVSALFPGGPQACEHQFSRDFVSSCTGWKIAKLKITPQGEISRRSVVRTFINAMAS